MKEELVVQQRLAATLQHKLESMRCYDVERLQTLTLSESEAVTAAQRAALRRRQAGRRLSESLFGKKDEPVGASEMAAACEEPQRSGILTLAGQLRGAAETTQRLNRINRIATRKLLGHMEHVFRVIAQAGRDIGLYGRAGRKPLMQHNRLIDAIA